MTLKEAYQAWAELLEPQEFVNRPIFKTSNGIATREIKGYGSVYIHKGEMSIDLLIKRNRAWAVYCRLRDEFLESRHH